MVRWSRFVICYSPLCIVIGHLLEESPWMNESITALIIGAGTGVMILLISGGKSSHLFVFSEDLFFICLLPPIIFNAGFQVKKKQFFRNFGTIMMFGALGTLVSFTIISLEVKFKRAKDEEMKMENVEAWEWL